MLHPTLAIKSGTFLVIYSSNVWLYKWCFYALQLSVFTTSHLWNQMITENKVQFSCRIVHVSLQGSSRKGQQFGVTVEIFTSSKTCFFPVKYIISSEGQRKAHNFKLFVIFGSLYRREIFLPWREGIKIIHIAPLCLDDVLKSMNLVCNLTVHWTVD